MRLMCTKMRLAVIAVFLSFIAFTFVFPVDSALAQSGMGSGMRPEGMRPGHEA